MATRLIIDGNAVYEIDEDCLECRGKKKEKGTAKRRGYEEKGRESPDLKHQRY